MTDRYKIVRFSFNGDKRTVRRGLSLQDAQMICCDPLTKSKPGAKNPWFYGYTRDEKRIAR